MSRRAENFIDHLYGVVVELENYARDQRDKKDEDQEFFRGRWGMAHQIRDHISVYYDTEINQQYPNPREERTNG